MADQRATSPKLFSKWWPIGCAIACVVVYILGGALIGSVTCYITTDGFYDYTTCNTGQYDAGLAFVAIASILFLVTIVLLVIYLIRRPKHVIVVNQNGGTNAVSDVPQTNYQQHTEMQPVPVKYEQPPMAQEPMSPAPTYTTQAPVATGHEMSAGGKTCRSCEMSGVQSPFCPRCGNAL